MILNINNKKEDIGINNVKKDMEPTSEDRKMRFKDALRFNVLFTVKRSKKSKNKLRKNTKSK